MQLTEGQVEQFATDGYLFFPSLFSGEEVELLRRALAEMSTRCGPEILRELANESEIKIIFGVDEHSEAYRRLTSHPIMLLPSERLLGSPVYVYQARINLNNGFARGGWGWHQDFNQWYRQDGLQHPRALLAAVFLDDINECNAPLMVIPRSHKRGHIFVPDRMEIDKPVVAELVAEGGIKALLGPAGSVAFIDSNTVHGSTPNISPWPRSICYMIYNSVENTEILHPRGDFRCRTDFTPLSALDESCLRQLVEA